MDDARAYLVPQQQLLSAVLQRAVLPGSSKPLDLPDLNFVTQEKTINLSSENLAEGLAVPVFDKPLRILSCGCLTELAKSQQTLAYLQFDPPQKTAGGVTLSLWIRLMTNQANQRVLGLSGVMITFGKEGTTWKQVGDPVYLAN